MEPAPTSIREEVERLTLAELEDRLREEIHGWELTMREDGTGRCEWRGAPNPRGDVCTYARTWAQAQMYIQPEIVKMGGATQTFYFDAEDSAPWACEIRHKRWRVWSKGLGLPEVLCRCALILARCLATENNDDPVS